MLGAMSHPTSAGLQLMKKEHLHHPGKPIFPKQIFPKAEGKYFSIWVLSMGQTVPRSTRWKLL